MSERPISDGVRERGQGEEHAMFRESVRAFVRREVAPRVLEWESDGAVPREVFARMGELGFLGVRLPRDYGGSGLDFRFTGILVEELVRCGSVGVPVSVMAHAEFSTRIIAAAGTPTQKARYLPRAISGEWIGALGVSEPDAGSDVAAIRTSAVRDGDHYVVNGAKTFITNGTIADFVTMAVRTGGPGARGVSLLVVPTDAPGFLRASRLRKVGTHASDTAEIVLEDCRVPVENRIGPEGGGFPLIMQGFEAERLVLALLCTAQMQLMFDTAREYGHDRAAFGRPILGFQVWRHRLADVLTTIEAARALTRDALERYVRGEECNAAVSMAKLFASESAIRVAHECAQIHGGNSYMEEYLIGRLYRDSLAFTIGAGTSEIMREIIARHCGLEPARG